MTRVDVAESILATRPRPYRPAIKAAGLACLALSGLAALPAPDTANETDPGVQWLTPSGVSLAPAVSIGRPDAATMALFDAAWSDAQRLGLGTPFVRSIAVVTSDVPAAEADPLSGLVTWPASNYAAAPEWWQAAYARHEVAHVLTPGGAHGPTFRATWDALLAPIGVTAVYAPGATYPTLEPAV